LFERCAKRRQDMLGSRFAVFASPQRLAVDRYLALSLLYLDFAILPPSATLAEVVDGAVYGV
jgi:hypothetical protein